MTFRDNIIEIARQEIGPHTKGSERVRHYWREVLPVSWSDAQVRQYAATKSWCGGFALYCLRRAGLARDVYWIDGDGFVGPARLPLTKHPLAGDVAYFDQPYQHHALVVVADRDWLTSIDGNQPDVRERARRLLGTERFYSIAPLMADAMRPDTLPPDTDRQPPAVDPPTLRQGDSGPAVVELQGRLGIRADGSFGPVTRDAVQAFQRAHGLEPDGVVGPKTWSQLLSEGAS